MKPEKRSSDDGEVSPAKSAAKPPSELTSNVLDKPGNRKTEPKGEPITVGKFYDYLTTVGKTSWRESKTRNGRRAWEIVFAPKEKPKLKYEILLEQDDSGTGSYRAELFCEACATLPKYFDTTKEFITLYTAAMK